MIEFTNLPLKNCRCKFSKIKTPRMINLDGRIVAMCNLCQRLNDYEYNNRGSISESKLEV